MNLRSCRSPRPLMHTRAQQVRYTVRSRHTQSVCRPVRVRAPRREYAAPRDGRRSRLRPRALLRARTCARSNDDLMYQLCIHSSCARTRVTKTHLYA